ncbi:tyrosine-type recombinase/integrase [Halalkalibacter okhensis]|uniref:tyrosine-type recombinase/integrase n=1 Tax=Halalkalibacter okhensis TaxID=333138 RepID=UPI0027E4E128|nr:tyrosine-type recombinase/integrase [Halalkalibacter okhensis]
MVLTGRIVLQLSEGREIRNIRCDIWLKRYIHNRKDTDPAIFVTDRSPHRMSIAQRYIIKRISSRAGINKTIHPHQLRNSYATHLLNNGPPIDVIQSLLGHEKTETTETMPVERTT